MTVLSDLAIAVLLGIVFATGLVLVSTRVPRLSAPTLNRRIAPYLREIADPLGLTPAAPVVPPGLAARTRVLLGSRSAGLQRRLSQAGVTRSVVRHRAHRLWWITGGLVAGGAIAVTAAMITGASAATVVLPAAAATVAGIVHDVALTRAIRRRRTRIADEVPTVLEFLALCLAAGEGLRDALARVGAVGTGELTGELRRAIVDSGTGARLADALQTVSARLEVPSFARAVDHIVAAMERGAPLAQVLQEQASDAREEAKRGLIELAGKKEIAMLLPLVFLLLPLSVIFAVFPGIVMLRLGG